MIAVFLCVTGSDVHHFSRHVEPGDFHGLHAGALNEARQERANDRTTSIDHKIAQQLQSKKRKAPGKVRPPLPCRVSMQASSSRQTWVCFACRRRSRSSRAGSRTDVRGLTRT
jgi:hypothetical protein